MWNVISAKTMPGIWQPCNNCDKLNYFKGVCRSTPKQEKYIVQKRKQYTKCNEEMKETGTIQIMKMIGIYMQNV